MNRIQRMISGAPAERRFNVENPAFDLNGLASFILHPTAAGVTVNQHTALNLSAVWRAVTMRAGGVASMPLHAYTLGDKGKREDKTKDWPVLWDPNPDLTVFEYTEMSHMHVDLWGNHYSYKIYDFRTNTVRYLEPILPERCTPYRVWDDTEKRMVKRFKVSAVQDGSPVVLDMGTDEIFHIMGPSLDGIKGMSAIQHAQQSLGLAMAAEVYGARFFESGALMSGMLTTDSRLDEPKANALKDRFQAAYGGLNKAHEVAVLDSGAKFMPMSIPPEDAQFLETRRFSTTEVSRWYHTPPHLLMELEKSTSWGSGIEQQDLAYVKHGLSFSVNRIAARYKKDILPEDLYAEHNMDAMLRADISTRYKAYTDGVEAGYLSRADVRRKENESVDDERLEEFLQPQNAYTVDQIERKLDAEIKTAEANAKKAEMPPPAPVLPPANGDEPAPAKQPPEDPSKAK